MAPRTAAAADSADSSDDEDVGSWPFVTLEAATALRGAWGRDLGPADGLDAGRQEAEFLGRVLHALLNRIAAIEKNTPDIEPLFFSHGDFYAERWERARGAPCAGVRCLCLDLGVDHVVGARLGRVVGRTEYDYRALCAYVEHMAPLVRAAGEEAAAGLCLCQRMAQWDPNVHALNLIAAGRPILDV